MKVAESTASVIKKTEVNFTGLKRCVGSQVLGQKAADPVDPVALKIATEIVSDIEKRGMEALAYHCKRLGDIKEEVNRFHAYRSFGLFV